MCTLLYRGTCFGFKLPWIHDCSLDGGGPELPDDAPECSADATAAATADGDGCDGGRQLLDGMSQLAEAVHGTGAPPEPPTICCMSGCANCVWIDYAERLADHYRDGGEAARRAIYQHVQDPSLRAFLLLELKTRR